MDDINPEHHVTLTEKIRHCQKTVGSFLKEYESLLEKQKSAYTAANSDSDSDRPVEARSPIVHDTVTRRLKEIDLVFKSNQQQLKIALEQYLSTQSALLPSGDCSTIQCDDNYGITDDAKVTINRPVNLSDDNNEVKLNPTVQALFTGTLPDDFFLHLMSVMGIQECLLINRLVCLFWNDLVLERCHNQKSLKLFETFDTLMEYGEWLLRFEKTDDISLILKTIGDDLLFEGLGIDHKELVKRLHQDDDEDTDDDTEECKIQTDKPTREKKLEASKVLTTVFPKIEELVLCTEQHTLINIEHLLQFYAEQLTSLTMTRFEGLDESQGSKLRDLSFPKLKSLNTFEFSPQDDQLLSLLPQLESLTLEDTEISLETLLRTGTQLRELNIGYIQSVYTAPMDEFSKCPLINSNLRKLTFGSTQIKLQVLEFISRNLTSLECLKLNFQGTQDNIRHLHALTSYLVALQQLHSLTLQAPLFFFLLNDTQLAEIKPLPSVRRLKLLLCDYASLSMDLFARALSKAFPKVEQVLITFVGYIDHRNAATISAFEAFAGKHPNVVQLFRSKDMSKCTNFPNAISPLLGHRRQVYEEYLEGEELFGVAIGKLAASFVRHQVEDGEYRLYYDYHNVMSDLRSADRLSAMSTLLQLLWEDDYENSALDFEMVYAMVQHLIGVPLKYGPSQVELFTVTLNCVDSLLRYHFANKYDSEDSQEVPDFLYMENCEMSPFFVRMVKLLEHYQSQQFNDKKLLLQIFNLIGQFLSRFKHNFELNYNSLPDNQLDEYELFKILLKLADHYQTQELSVLDHERLLLQIRDLMDNRLQMFTNEFLDQVMSEFLDSENGVYRVEMALALLRKRKRIYRCFKELSGEADGDSSDSESNESHSGDSTIIDGSSSSAESDL